MSIIIAVVIFLSTLFGAPDGASQCMIASVSSEGYQIEVPGVVLHFDVVPGYYVSTPCH